MTSFASLDDVNRILTFTTGDDPARDAQLQAALEAVESAMTSRLRSFTTGDAVAIHHDIPAGSTIGLPGPEVTVTAVRVQGSFTEDYDVSGSAVILRPQTLWPNEFAGWQGDTWDGPRLDAAFDQPMLGYPERVYRTVEIFYTGTSVIPKAVTEGIAFATAGYWKHGPAILGGLYSEKIGDYQYTRSAPRAQPGQAPEYIETAMFFLKDYFKGARVSVT